MRIEINLLGRQKRKKAGATGMALPDFKNLFAQVKDPLFLGAVVAWIVAVVAIGSMFVTQTARISSAQNEAQRARTEARRYSIMMAQKRKAEGLRDSLVMQLDAIREIDSHRYVWPHVLEEITKALPDFTWLVSVNVLTAPPATGTEADSTAPQVVRVQIDGRTSEIAGYTRFIRQLQASPWIGEVVPGPTTTVVEDDKPLTAFGMTAIYQQADSAYIRTVPVTESVR